MDTARTTSNGCVGHSSPARTKRNSIVGRGWSTRASVAMLILAFAVSLSIMVGMALNFPELDEDDIQHLRFPNSLDAAKELGRLLSKYKDTHFGTVIIAVMTTYVFLQTFSIPGSIFLSILSGFLFSYPLALFLVCMCSALGAAFCYLLSMFVCQKLVRKYFPSRLKTWQDQIAHHHDDMLWYIIFLRITPFLPNFFINIASPVVGVKLVPFFVGTFLGVAPPSFFFIRAGTTLYQLTTASGHVSIHSILILAFLAILSLLPVFFKKVIKKKME